VEIFPLGRVKNWIKTCKKGRKDGTIYDFAITDARDGTILGDCGLNDIRKSDKTANLDYWVRTPHETGRLYCRGVITGRFRLQKSSS